MKIAICEIWKTWVLWKALESAATHGFLGLGFWAHTQNHLSDAIALLYFSYLLYFRAYYRGGHFVHASMAILTCPGDSHGSDELISIGCPPCPICTRIEDKTDCRQVLPNVYIRKRIGGYLWYKHCSGV